jgi:hypothetical protein
MRSSKQIRRRGWRRRPWSSSSGTLKRGPRLTGEATSRATHPCHSNAPCAHKRSQLAGESACKPAGLRVCRCADAAPPGSPAPRTIFLRNVGGGATKLRHVQYGAAAANGHGRWLTTIEEFSTTGLKDAAQASRIGGLIRESHGECKNGAAIRRGKLVCIARKAGVDGVGQDEGVDAVVDAVDAADAARASASEIVHQEGVNQ